MIIRIERVEIATKELVLPDGMTEDQIEELADSAIENDDGDNWEEDGPDYDWYKVDG